MCIRIYTGQWDHTLVVAQCPSPRAEFPLETPIQRKESRRWWFYSEQKRPEPSAEK